MFRSSRKPMCAGSGIMIAVGLAANLQAAVSTQTIHFSETVFAPPAGGRADVPFPLSMSFQQLNPAKYALDEVLFEYHFDFMAILTIPANSGGGGSGSIGGTFYANGAGFVGDGGGNGAGGGGPAIIESPFVVPAISPDGTGNATVSITAATNPDAFQAFAGTGTVTVLWDTIAATDFEPSTGGTAELHMLDTSHVTVIYKFTPVCPVPFADTDSDGDVDQDDFGTWQRCFSGTTAIADPVGCFCLDRDQNNVIDSKDLEAFQNCVSGPALPANKSCGG